MIRRYSNSWLDPTDRILDVGEIAVDATVNQVKLGDGTNAVSALPTYGTGKQQIWIPAAGMLQELPAVASISNLTAGTNKQTYTVIDLDGGTDEWLHFQVPFPKRWNKGTITYQVYWTSQATDADAVVWGLQAVAGSDGDAIDVAFGTAVLVTDNLQSAAGKVLVSPESAPLTIAGTPADGDLVFFRLYRDADNAVDSAAEDARVIGVKIFYTSEASSDD